MFDLPDAKRIRRSDLFARSRSASPTPSSPTDYRDPELDARLLHERLAGIYGDYVDTRTTTAAVVLGGGGQLLDATSSTTATTATSVVREQVRNKQPGGVEEDGAGDDDWQEYEFRLFSSSGSGVVGGGEQGDADRPAKVQRVMIRNGEEALGEGAFVVRDRDPEYFFARRAEGLRRRQFEQAAVTWEDVQRQARRRAWGLEVPWRVRVIKVQGKGSQDSAARAGGDGNENDDEEPSKKRRRPGKKRRVILRGKIKRIQAAEEQRNREREAKEEADREKRTRRNREKKVKRKMKGKAQKSAAAVGGANDAVEPTGEMAAVPMSSGGATVSAE